MNTRIITGKVKHPGRYDSVNLNGWTLASEQEPPQHKTVLLGYRVPHLPEVWFGVGYRRDSMYWLGARGLNPNYDRLSADQVVIWKNFDKPFSFSDRYPGEQIDYLQYQYILGDEANKEGVPCQQ